MTLQLLRLFRHETRQHNATQLNKMGSGTESSSDSDDEDFKKLTQMRRGLTSRQRVMANQEKEKQKQMDALPKNDDRMRDLEQMLADKAKTKKAKQKIIDQAEAKIQEISAKMKEAETAATQIDTNALGRSEREGFVPLSLISCFSEPSSESADKPFPLSGLLFSPSKAGSDTWDGVRSRISTGIEGIDIVLKHGLVPRICRDHNLSCPDDVAQWLFCVALGVLDPVAAGIDNTLPITGSSGFELEALATFAAVMLNDPELSASLGLHQEISLAIKRSKAKPDGSNKRPLAARPSWRPSTKLFLALLEWAGLRLGESMRVPEFQESKRAWHSAHKGKPKLPIGSLLSVLQVCLLTGHFDIGRDSDVLDLMVRLFVLRTEQAALSASGMQSLSTGQDALVELIDFLPKTTWCADFVRQLCCALTDVAKSVDRTSLVSQLAPEMQSAECSVDATLLLLAWVQHLPANHVRCNILKRMICIGLLRGQSATTLNLAAKLPVLGDATLWSNSSDSKTKEAVAAVAGGETDKGSVTILNGASAVKAALSIADSQDALSELGPGLTSAVHVEPVVAAMMPNIKTFVLVRSKQQGGMSGFDMRCLVAMLRIAAVFLHDIPKIEQVEPGPGKLSLRQLAQVRDEIYTGLDQVLYRLPKASSYTGLLMYISQMITALLQEHKRMQKKRTSLLANEEERGQSSLDSFITTKRQNSGGETPKHL